MEVLCISSFNEFGRIKGITFNRVYQVRLFVKDRLFIKDDFGRIQMIKSHNFINYKKDEKRSS